MKKSQPTNQSSSQPVENFSEYPDSTSVDPVENSDEQLNKKFVQPESDDALSEDFDDSFIADLEEVPIQNLPPDPAAKIAELTTDLQRTRADFENFRKQADLQKNQAMTSARYATVQKFLPLLDDFQRALTAYPEQLGPLSKNFQKLLQNLRLEAIESAPGTEFNPDLHEAISVEDGEGDVEVVVETLRPGYLYEGDVIRAAMVKVGHSSAKPPRKSAK